MHIKQLEGRTIGRAEMVNSGRGKTINLYDANGLIATCNASALFASDHNRFDGWKRDPWQGQG